MEFLAELWLPSALSAVLIFIASSIMHMVIGYHRSDYQRLASEPEFLEHMRGHTLKPGDYMFPAALDMQDFKDPAVLERFQQGPVGFLRVLPTGLPNLGKNLTLWFIFTLVVTLFVAYIGSLALKPGAPYLDVFQVVGTTAILAYAAGAIPESIWKGQRWGVTARFVVDGVIYGLVTAGTFGWLWPDAVTG